MLIPPEALAALVFYVLSGLAIAGAIGIIVARRVFHSALFLVLTLGSVAGAFVLLGADFLAAVQVLIYVGAITILILFGVMLTPQSADLPTLGGKAQSVAGVALAALLFVITSIVAVTGPWQAGAGPALDGSTSELIGTSLFSTFVLPFEIASVLLLVAMIGAIVVARED